MDLNNIIIDLGGVERILSAITYPATDTELLEHLAQNCIGDNVPTLKEVKAHMLVYQHRLDNPDIPVPESLTPRQIRLALNANGLLAMVEAAMQQADRPTQIMWEFSTEYLRNDPILLATASGLGLSYTQLDALFIQGATL